MPTDARLALVTGAGSGIGRACALALGKRGFALAVIDLDEGSARETASQIPGAKAYRADVSNAAEVEAAVGAAVADLGPLEVLVNNAGILDGYFNVDEMDESLWRRVIDIDLTGVFLGCKRAVAEMLPRGQRPVGLAETIPAAKPTATSVQVVMPRRSAASSELLLPGNVQAVQEAALFARTNGYVHRRLVDIGDRVSCQPGRQGCEGVDVLANQRRLLQDDVCDH